MSTIKLPASIRRSILFLLLCGMACGLAEAQQVVTKIYSAHAVKEEDDEFGFGNRSDFNVVVKVNASTPQETGYLNDFDHRTFAPFVVTESILPTERWHTVTVSLLERDPDPDGIAPYDINPIGWDSVRDMTLTFDACTLSWRGDWSLTQEYLGGEGPGYNGTCMPRGDWDHEPGWVCLEITTDDGMPLSTTDDVSIRQAGPVQAVYNPAEVVHGKPMAFRVDLRSSWSTDKLVHLTVTLDDGVSPPAVDQIDVVVPPGGIRQYLFDGNADQPPFVPRKNPSDPNLRYTVQVDVDGGESPPPDAHPDFMNCWGANNGIGPIAVPVVINREPRTAYMRWDWDATPPLLPDVPTFMATHDQSERYRNTVLPLASVTPAADSRIDVPWITPHDLFGVFAGEPETTIFLGNIAAAISGIDRLILTPRNNWFDDNVAGGVLGTDWSGVIGVAYGPWMPRAVISEAGFTEVATHEFLHTYGHSFRTCSGGPDGCRDEYLHTPPVTYWAEGYDIAGDFYPAGKNDFSPGDVPAGSREVTAANIMDSCCGNWIDSFTYDIISRQLRNPQDPELVNLSGFVSALNGIGDPQPQFGGQMVNLYHFDGFPDVADPGFGGSAGRGRFSVQLVTPNGRKTYRFDPYFGRPESDVLTDQAAFSIAVPWDPNVIAIELFAPVDYHDAENNPQESPVWTRNRSANPPTIQTVRAGRDTAPDLDAQLHTPPTIGPGSELVLGWRAADADNEALRSSVVLHGPPSPSTQLPLPVPVAVELDATELRMPHAQLAAYPGSWGARLAVTDGVDGAWSDETFLFEVCNYTNQGIEICDNVDNDCDGLLDNLAETPVVSIAENKIEIGWTYTGCPDLGSGFDVLRGNLSDLRSSGNFFNALCWENDSLAGPSWDQSAPASGDGFYYLVRVDGQSWGAGRDATVIACP